MGRKTVMRNEKGFTLIEIISVLILLGVLAAQATPRFFDLISDAREKAAVAAFAEVKARCSQAYAKQLLVADGDTTAITAATIIADPAITATPDLGRDFVVKAAVAVNGRDILITVVQVQSKVIIANNETTWEMPQMPS
jgi:prepilin-type N-terminal cleavage/methylation domain-containing protein